MHKLLKRGSMFNFFSEIKKNIKNNEILGEYNLINISGQVLYVEGHKGITFISKEVISFKVKNGRINVEGKNLNLSELADSVLKIVGEIQKIEAF